MNKGLSSSFFSLPSIWFQSQVNQRGLKECFWHTLLLNSHRGMLQSLFEELLCTKIVEFSRHFQSLKIPTFTSKKRNPPTTLLVFRWEHAIQIPRQKRIFHMKSVGLPPWQGGIVCIRCRHTPDSEKRRKQGVLNTAWEAWIENDQRILPPPQKKKAPASPYGDNLWTPRKCLCIEDKKTRQKLRQGPFACPEFWHMKACYEWWLVTLSTPSLVAVLRSCQHLNFATLRFGTPEVHTWVRQLWWVQVSNLPVMVV